MLLYELRNNFLPQLVEGGRVTEEVGDIDEEVLGEQLTLGRILAQDAQIARAVLEPGHRHAPLEDSAGYLRVLAKDLAGA